MVQRRAVFLSICSLLLLIQTSSHGVEIIADEQVSLYGRLSLDSYWGRDGEESHLGLSSNDTYIGFNGKIPLEQGYRALWQLEQSINLDEGGNSWASRDSFIALTNDTLEFKVGQFDTPYKKVLSPIGYFEATLGDLRSIVGASASAAGLNVNLRAKNSMQTTWQVNSQLKLVGAYSSDIVGGDPSVDDNDRDLSSIAGYWKADKLWLGAAWQTQELQGISGLRVVAKLDNGNFVLGGFAELTNSDDIAFHEHLTFGGNIKYPWMTNNYLVGQLVIVEEDDSIDDSSAVQLTGGAFHNLGQNFKVYGTFSLVSNDKGAAYGLGFERSDQLVSSGAGEDVVAFALGFLVEI